MASSKRKSMTLEEKLTVIKNNNRKRIAEEMVVGPNQIKEIIINKSEIRDEYESNYAMNVS